MHGNGGLLTTVGDLLKWNENYVRPQIGDAALVAEQQKAGKYSDGRDLEYGLGLFVRPLDGVKNIYHSGSTAGYRAHLNRFPDSQTSVAVLCNGSDGNATNAANIVSRLYLGMGGVSGIVGGITGGITGGIATESSTPPNLNEFAGEYWSDEAETKFTAMVDKGRLVLRRRPGVLIELEQTGKDAFRGQQLGTVTFRRNAAGAVEGLSIKQDRVWDLRFARQN